MIISNQALLSIILGIYEDVSAFDAYLFVAVLRHYEQQKGKSEHASQTQEANQDGVGAKNIEYEKGCLQQNEN